MLARGLRQLGREIGAAAWTGGALHERPKNDELRMDLTLTELLAIRWLAHAGLDPRGAGRGTLLCTTWISPFHHPRGVTIEREMGVAVGSDLTLA